LSQGVPQPGRAAVAAFTGSLPPAGRSRRLSPPDLLPARTAARRRAARFALGADGRAVRGLQGARRPTLLPRSFLPSGPADRPRRPALPPRGGAGEPG